MPGKTSIEWSEESWNPIVGCRRKDEGCEGCYAIPMAHRLAANPMTPHYAGLTQTIKARVDWTGKVGIAPDSTWIYPLEVKKPTVFFVDSMGDPFYREVKQRDRDRMMATILLSPLNTYQLPTKRPEEALAYFSDPAWRRRVTDMADEIQASTGGQGDGSQIERLRRGELVVLPNLWLGTSIALQKHADARWPSMKALHQMGWMTWVSYEPALGPVDWGGWEFLSWMVGGGMSGSYAKLNPMHPDWQRTTRDWCASNRIPYFFKQWGDWLPCDPEELPERFGTDCERFSVVCSNGFVGELAVSSALLHKPSRWPQCFPDGADGDACCTTVCMKRLGKGKAGRVLDGRTHDDHPPYAHEVAA